VFRLNMGIPFVTGLPIPVSLLHLLSGIAGLWLCRAGPPAATGHVTVPVSRTVGLAALAAFFLLLAGLPVLRGLVHAQGIALFEAFYRAGALVFGGGHVVLPLLREAFVTPGWVSEMPSLPATAPRRRFRDLCSPSRPILAPSSARHRTG